ncbi:carbonic anhydrase [Bradyrhizobium sp. GCM10027634]|uniref:carbonic anhydrase n=1 Tax=Bradyrhizobium TaxID=374 RepID=UPI0024BF1DC5|nr:MULTISPECIES: carbonic anhydrase [Bradyrhizobium]MDN4984479.1 carbonic anhydrase [Bradyrhizobium sp. WYCCWR 13022]MDN5002471.1 carbonic anhydrase [Bradyrhizobium sp. WYCCWR 12677]MDT4736900.1 carbonic anhydrase [Bradyrhizobium sp. WYCCWR 12699]
MIGCCDSRVSPELIFNARPEEIFVIRNVAARTALRCRGRIPRRRGCSGCARSRPVWGVPAYAKGKVSASPESFTTPWMQRLVPVAHRAGRVAAAWTTITPTWSWLRSISPCSI